MCFFFLIIKKEFKRSRKTLSGRNIKQLLDEVFVISRIIEVEVGVIRKAEADNPYRDLAYSGYHKNQI